ncbi:hypothetical protein IF650_12370 [Cellulosimicrobium terreum]|nr:hypothetical protein [Cellulosimicrobium terreum]
MSDLFHPPSSSPSSPNPPSSFPPPPPSPSYQAPASGAPLTAFAPPQDPSRPDPFRASGGPTSSPTARRRGVVIGVAVGVSALVVMGGVWLGATYVMDNAATLLASPSDLPDEGWYEDEWTDDEVWADSPGSGTPEHPWSIGSTVYGPEWDVTLATPRDATAEILAADPVAAPPAGGAEYWVVPASAYYWGLDEDVDEPGSVRLAFVDDAGVEHATGCPGVPGALVTTGELTPDATLVGSLCVTVPAGADGVWRLTLGHGEPAHLTVR